MREDIIKAYAKINLFLHIIGKRSDGYHLLESLFAFTTVADVIEIKPAKTLSVNFINAEINSTNNTIYRAVELLAQHLKQSPNFSISIKKEIPAAAGIGGGSAGAAAALKYLCELWDTKVTQDVYNIALKVGADVPACLYNVASFVSGIGENIKVLQDFPPFVVVVVNPGIHVNTKEIFSYFSGEFTKSNTKIFEEKSVLEVIMNTENDLQAIVESLHPEVCEVISNINMQDGCVLSRMSGSGPTCFGIFEDKENAQKALISLRKKFFWVELTTLN